MRQFKFRAWNKKHKYMTDDIDLYSSNGEWKWFYGDYAVDDDFVIMQFTRLLDKNSKEIYEGDILKFPFEGYLRSWKLPENGRVEVKWMHYVYYPFERLPEDKTEIIGNIYQNPELLETELNVKNKHEV
jgi:hypothetical protein